MARIEWQKGDIVRVRGLKRMGIAEVRRVTGLRAFVVWHRRSGDWSYWARRMDLSRAKKVCQHAKRHRVSLAVVGKTKHQRNRTWHTECLRCGAWLSTGPASSARRDELKLAVVLADLAQLWEPGAYRDELMQSTIEWFAAQALIAPARAGTGDSNE